LGVLGARAMALTDERRLLERESELAALDQALDGARAGCGRLVVVEAGPGLGKSSLLELAGRRAARLGLRVLRARGFWQERALLFGGVLQLFEGLLHRAPARERSRLLSGAAALARELFESSAAPAAPRGEARAAAIIHGLFWLTANLSEPDAGDRPLAMLVDDAHLLDALSLRFLLYLGSRLGELPVAVAVATRPAAAPDAPAELAALGDRPAAVPRPAPLSAEAVAELVCAELSTPTVAPQFTEAIVEVTGGNPFLVRELVAELCSEGIKPRPEAAARVAALVPDSVLQAVLARLARLRPAAVAIAKALVVLGDGAPLELAGALAQLGPEEAAAAADALATEGILADDAPLRFAHPLIGEAIARDLPSGWRAASELRAARLLAARGEGPERVAAHLLCAAAGGDLWVVEVLERAAELARARGGPQIAAAYLRRAVAEPPAPGDRARLLSALAQAEAAAGMPDAIIHLDQALALINPGAHRAQLLLALGRLLALGGRFHEALAAFERGLSEPQDPRGPLARELKAAIAYTGASGEGSATAMSAVIDELRGVPAGQETALERGVLALAAAQAALVGRPAAEFGALAARALEGGTLVDDVVRDGGLLLTPAAVALLYADELELSLSALDAALERARRYGSVLAQATVSYLRCWPLYFTGQLSDAIADAEQALSARRYGWSVHAGAACAVLAHARIERGELDGARAALDEAESLGLDDAHWARAALLVARARLRLEQHNPAGALDDLRDCGERLQRQGVAGRPIPWRGFAALAALALGDRRQALALAGEEHRRAQQIGAPRIVGIALRIRGLVEGGEQGLASLQAAAEVPQRSPSKLEYARALVDLGALMRRTASPVASREPLRRGLELAQRFGARPLAQRAREELHASGARPRRAALRGVDSLTPSERRVAQLAAAGLTNRQIAQQLFVTTKAVEYHLRNAF